MRMIYRLVLGILACALYGAAYAHGISIDAWGPADPSNPTYSGTSVVLDPSALPQGISLTGISSLSFSTGSTTLNSYQIASTLPGEPTDPADGYVWGNVVYENDAVTDGIQVALLACGTAPCQFTASPTLTIAFGYGDFSAGCGDEVGETASVSVNGKTYQATNPCSLSSGAGDLTFQNGVLEAGSGVGWTETTVPLPASFWLMLGGLGGLRALARKNRAT